MQLCTTLYHACLAPRSASPRATNHPARPCRAAHDAAVEQEALLALAAQLAALVEAYDRVARDEQAMEAAAESFSSLLQARCLLIFFVSALGAKLFGGAGRLTSWRAFR